MTKLSNQSTRKSSQGGASLIVVLVLLSVMVLAIASMARLGETNFMLAGNIAVKDAALGASEVGVSDAYIALSALSATDSAVSSWYRATYDATNDSSGVPGTNVVTWTDSGLNKKLVGNYTVRYLVERMCSTTPVTDPANQCMIKKAYAGNSSKAGAEALESTPGIQYRITVNVVGPKNSSTFVQALVVF